MSWASQTENYTLDKIAPLSVHLTNSNLIGTGQHIDDVGSPS